MMTRRFALMLLCASVRVARAEDAALARELNAAATKAMDAGDLPTALRRYHEAYDAYPTPKLHFNLGLVLDKMNRRAEAANELQAFLDEVPGASPDAQRFAHERIDALAPTLGRLTVRCVVAAAIVRLDGVVKACDRPRFVDPGEHSLEVGAEGYDTLRRSVSMPRGEMTIEAPLAKYGSAPTVVMQSDTPPAEPRHASSRVAPIAIGVVSGAVLVAGIGMFAAERVKLSNDHDEAARGETCGSSSCGQAERDANIKGIGYAGVALMAVGGAGLIVDIALWVRDARQRRAAR